MVTAKIYAYMLALVVTLWPLFLLLTPMPLFKILLLIALSAALWVLVWKFCDSPQGSFIIGLSIIAATTTHVRPDGDAFGKGPILKSDIPEYQGDVGTPGPRVVNSHATAPGRDVGEKDNATGSLTSKPDSCTRFNQS